MRKYHGVNAQLPWTDAEDRFLKQSVKSGKKTSWIANKLGRTAGAVRARAKGIGLSLMKYWQADEDRKLTKLYGNGVRLGEISKELCRSKLAVSSRINVLGLKRKKYLPTEIKDHLLGEVKGAANEAGLDALVVARRLVFQLVNEKQRGEL